MFKNYVEMFVGQSQEVCINTMKELLIKAGFSYDVVEKRGCRTEFFTKDGVSNAFAVTSNSVGVVLPIILPLDFLNKFYKEDGVFTKTIRLGSHSYNNVCYTPVLDYAGHRNYKMHRAIMIEAGKDIEGVEIDHVFNHQGMNNLEALRTCSSKENKANTMYSSVTTGEFGYRLNNDFRFSFWILVLHYVLGVINTEEMYSLNSIYWNSRVA